MNDREKYWIKYYDSYKNGYNMTPGGSSLSENIHSKETEEKRRETRELNQKLKGQNHPRAKLSNDEVIAIRQRYIDGESVKSIYQDYSSIYTIDTFRRIVLGSTYKNVGNIPPKNKIRYSNSKLTAQQVCEIRDKYFNDGIDCAELGKEYNLCPSTIGLIIKNKTYKHIK